MGWVEDRYEWSKDGFGDLLMMALPHHMDILDRERGSVAVVMTDGYQSIKVRDVGVAGRSSLDEGGSATTGCSVRPPTREILKALNAAAKHSAN